MKNELFKVEAINCINFIYFQSTVQNGHIEIIKILAPSDEDLNEPFPSGKTPYEYALEHKSVELIKILAPKVKNPNAPYSLNGYIPICRAIELGHMKLQKYWLL